MLRGADSAHLALVIVITIMTDNGSEAHDHTCPSEINPQFLKHGVDNGGRILVC